MRSYQVDSASHEAVRLRPTQQMQHLFCSLRDHNEMTCRACRHGDSHPRSRPFAPSHTRDTDDGQRKVLDATVAVLSSARLREHADEDALPPQTVLVRLLRKLEDDFTHHKSFVLSCPQLSLQLILPYSNLLSFRMYLELAEQYGAMDPASNVIKRNVLADHLREIIDILQKNGEEIAALYDALKL